MSEIKNLKQYYLSIFSIRINNKVLYDKKLKNC